MEASSPIPQKLLDKGYRLIVSTKDKWYLDHGFWGRTAYHDWKVMYNYKLYQHENVLGGEVAMWTEKVDHHSLDVKVWPRTAATAERLWSNPKLGANEAEGRFEHFRESLTKIGINADANSPYYCYENENECHSDSGISYRK
ncbi:hypothetical protein RUM43_013588 [Polyplax serrata]|uniref:beta-N-acetylhexosaminidase n=1 Tax=Polyplax serrata TaxID=468196 RepID=A0AAN8S3Y6_POLSC